MGARLGASLIAAATALVILGAAILPFTTPAYVRLEQVRAGVALDGYAPADLERVADRLLGDLLLWRGDFDVAVSGSSVLSAREVAHMQEVRGVFAGFWALVVASAVAIAVAFRRSRDAEARAATWRAIASGARALAIGLAVVGAFVVLAFDAAFEVFHRLFFSAGSYTFDPRTDHLVQLFPQQFWSDTAMAVGAVSFVVALLTAWWAGARRRVSRPAAVLAPSKVRT